MKIKFANKNTPDVHALWRNAPCSMNYILQNPSMDKADKFKVGSIYHRDQVDKPKKVFTEFEKPDLLLI